MQIQRLIPMVSVVLITLLALPASAHTQEELDDWQAQFAAEALEVGLSPDLLAEWVDMAVRHPVPFGRPAPHVHAQRRRAVFTGGVEQWRPLVAQYFRPSDVDTALRIMGCESGGDPNAVGKDQDIGLMQHLARYWVGRSAKAGWAGASAFNPEANIAVAAWLRDSKGGWGHWTCY